MVLTRVMVLNRVMVLIRLEGPKTSSIIIKNYIIITMMMMTMMIMMMAFRQIPTMTKSHHGGNMSEMDMVKFCQGVFPPLKMVEVGLGEKSYIFEECTKLDTV